MLLNRLKKTETKRPRLVYRKEQTQRAIPQIDHRNDKIAKTMLGINSACPLFSRVNIFFPNQDVIAILDAYFAEFEKPKRRNWKLVDPGVKPLC